MSVYLIKSTRKVFFGAIVRGMRSVAGRLSMLCFQGVEGVRLPDGCQESEFLQAIDYSVGSTGIGTAR